jgi:hypothetical protein
MRESLPMHLEIFFVRLAVCLMCVTVVVWRVVGSAGSRLFAAVFS